MAKKLDIKKMGTNAAAALAGAIAGDMISAQLPDSIGNDVKLGITIVAGAFLSTNKKDFLRSIGSGVIASTAPKVEALLGLPMPESVSGRQNIMGNDTQRKIKAFEMAMARSPQRGSINANSGVMGNGVMGQNSNNFGSSEF